VGKNVRDYEIKRLVKDAVAHRIEEVKHTVQKIRGKEPRENVGLNKQIDFARLSKSSYAHGIPARQVEGYDIVPDLTTDDRTVYRHHDTGKVIIAFRGTDTHDWGKKGDVKSFFHSRGFRDTTTDAILAASEQGRSHRFKNAEAVTNEAIKRYGHSNVIVTGHSLGGSQAMWVSNRTGVHAEVYNPHIDWEAAGSSANYYNTALHVNVTDPVAIYWHRVNWQSRDVRYNKKKAPFFAQHGIDNFMMPPRLAPKAETKPKPNGIRNFMNRPPSSSSSTIPVSMPKQREFNHGGDCSRMPLYMQLQYGCRSIHPR
jgi:hypothetical protein